MFALYTVKCSTEYVLELRAADRCAVVAVIKIISRQQNLLLSSPVPLELVPTNEINFLS